MLSFGAILIVLGEALIFTGVLFLFLELRRNFMAIRQTQTMINLFMDELLHPRVFMEKKDSENNATE